MYRQLKDDPYTLLCSMKENRFNGQSKYKSFFLHINIYRNIMMFYYLTTTNADLVRSPDKNISYNNEIHPASARHLIYNAG